MPVTKKRRSEATEQSEGDSHASIPLGRYLASTEKKIRDGAVKSLANYLSQSDLDPLSDIEMARLWKGIFYCFWMSDKPRVQQALAQELADLLLTIKAPSSSSSSPTKPALVFLQGFFDAMVREWPGLDKWRVDKFYLLFRRFLNAAFRLLADNGWENESVSSFTALLTKQGGPLCANDVKVPDGITYHLTDIYLEELDKAAGSAEESESDEVTCHVPLLSLLQPFIDTMANCHSSLVFDRISNAVITPLVDDCLTLQEEADESEPARSLQNGSSKRKRSDVDVQEEDSDDGEGESSSACEYAFIMHQLDLSGREMRQAIFDAIFQAASRSDSVEARRRRLYKLFKDEEQRLEEEEEAK